MASAETIPAATTAPADRPARRREVVLDGARQAVGGTLELADHVLHAPADLLHHAVSSVVVVNVDVGVDVDVDVAPRATRAIEGAGQVPARG